MNDNLGFDCIPSVQHQHQIINLQANFPVQSFPFPIDSSHVQPTNCFQQGTDNLYLNQISNCQSYCIDQNGMTYLALIAPTNQNPLCLQALETAQGLQLFQVIQSPQPVNLNPLCVQNISQSAQIFQPQSFTQSSYSQFQPQYQVQNYEEQKTEVKCNYQIDQVDDDQDSGEEGDSDSDFSKGRLEEEPESTQDYKEEEDPLSALTVLTSAVSSPSSLSAVESNCQSPFLFPCNGIPAAELSSIPVPPATSHQQHQFVQNTQTFQILVNTAQGKTCWLYTLASC